MRKTLLGLAFAGVVFAATSGFADEKADSKKPDPRIGEEVNSICFARTINGWKALKGVDNVVLLDKGVHDWYYVELTGYCPARVFQSAERIAIESRPAGGCLTRGDTIVVHDVGNLANRCFIKKMSKWDDKAHPAEDQENSSSESEIKTE